MFYLQCPIAANTIRLDQQSENFANFNEYFITHYQSSKYKMLYKKGFKQQFLQLVLIEHNYKTKIL